MAKRIGGARRKTRGKYKKDSRRRGKISLSAYYQTFKIGDKVVLKAEPSVQKGMYFRRFHGKVGKVTNIKTKSVTVQITDGAKQKKMDVLPIHLKPVKN